MDDDLVRVMFCLRRLPGLTLEQFRAHWRDVHAPLVQANAPLVGIRRYVQHHGQGDTRPELARPRRAAPAFDGIAELWIDRDFLERPMAPEGVAASRLLLEDERRFIDLAASSIFSTEPVEFPLAVS